MNEDKASRYHRLRRRAELLATTATASVLLLLLVSDSAVRLRESAAMVTARLPGPAADPATAALLALGLVLLLALVEAPFAFYQGFILEHRYGLSRQSAGHWAADLIKGTLLTSVFAVVGAAVVYAAIGWSPEWWWVLSAALFSIAIVGLVTLAPVLLLPLFYRFKPLDRPALAERLVRLSEGAGAHVAGVFEWTLSDHTRKANAALAGIGRTRRILLSDTLLAEYSEDEIEVILAHELAHHVHHDLWRGVAAQTALLFGGFFAAHLVLGWTAAPLGLAGMGDPAGLPLLVLAGGVWSFLAMPLVNALSRAHERRADRYALERTGNAGAFISAMKRLAQQNMAEEQPSAVVQWLFYSHPPIRDRVAAADRWQARQVQS